MTKGKERIGSSKKLKATSTLGRVFQTDLGLTSVFDVGVIEGFESEILAEARTKQAASLFRYLALNGVPSHFIEQVSHKSLEVLECQVQDKPLLSRSSRFEMIGLELLFRTGASEKFCGRVERGEIELDAAQHLSKGQKLEPGVTFRRPFVEASTKWDDLDGYLTPDEAARVANLSRKDLDRLYRWVGSIGSLLHKLFAQLGYDLVDGKVEVARDMQTGEFVLIDGISLDELGVMVGDEHHGKNLIRNWYKVNEPKWYAVLLKAQSTHKNDKSQWPPCPPLAAGVAELHEQRYVIAANRLDEAIAEMLEAA